MAKQNQTASELTVQDRLKSFSSKKTTDLKEGTSTYHKFEKSDDSFDGIFIGIEQRNLDTTQPDRLVDCAILLDANNERHLFAQTVIVKELKKKWDELKETNFPVRIVFKGTMGSGADQYQSFKLFFE